MRRAKTEAKLSQRATVDELIVDGLATALGGHRGLPHRSRRGRRHRSSSRCRTAETLLDRRPAGPLDGCREQPTSLLTVKSRVRVVALLVGGVALWVSAAAAVVGRLGDPTDDFDRPRRPRPRLRRRRRRRTDRHQHRSGRRSRTGHPGQQHPRDPHAAAATDRGADHDRVDRAARHRRAVSCRASGGGSCTPRTRCGSGSSTATTSPCGRTASQGASANRTPAPTRSFPAPRSRATSITRTSA